MAQRQSRLKRLVSLLKRRVAVLDISARAGLMPSSAGGRWIISTLVSAPASKGILF
jgi:hypothetical protein